MTLPRILSAVGRTLAILGAVMLLFVVFELWGTGLQQARAQSSLEGDFAERFRQAAAAGQGAFSSGTFRYAPLDGGDPPGAGGEGDAADLSAGTGSEAVRAAASGDGESSAARASAGASAATGGDGADAPAGPAAASLPEYPDLPHPVRHVDEPAVARSVARLLHPDVEAMLPLVYPDDGEAIARLVVPAIDVDEIVVAGVRTDDLRKGPGHYGTTPLPGQPGNAAIAGHRTTNGAPFGRIDELAPGDEIIVETLQGRFVYRVLPGDRPMAGRTPGYRIVLPTTLEVLDDHGDNRLTLTSCHPKYSSRQRIIVHAVLVGDPVVRLPRPGEPIGAEFVQLAQPEEPPDDGIDSERRDDAGPAAAGGEAGGGGTGGSEAGGGRGSSEQQALARHDDPDGARGTGSDGQQALAGGAEPGGADDGGDAAAREPGNTGPDTAATAEEGPDGAAAGEEPDGAAPQQAPLPVTPVADEGFGEGLSGDRSAILPAVLWGLAAVAVLVLASAWGRSGRRLRAYGIAAVPFLVVLYVLFSYVDRALPAY